MTPEAAPPPAPTADGCLGRSCLVFLGLSTLLFVALTGGALWGIHYLRQTYSATEKAPLPTIPDTSTVEAEVPNETASPMPQAATPAPDRLRELQARWDSFERAAARGQKARIELTAADINALIEGDSQLRGKAFVSIENNVGRVRVSIPLDELFMLGGRFLNGEATIEAAPDGDPAKARITNITLANQPVPDNILDRRVFGWQPIRTLINTWLEEHDVSTFSVEDGKVIGETRGSTR
jgi:hypothetical protein